MHFTRYMVTRHRPKIKYHMTAENKETEKDITNQQLK